MGMRRVLFIVKGVSSSFSFLSLDISSMAILALAFHAFVVSPPHPNQVAN